MLKNSLKTSIRLQRAVQSKVGLSVQEYKTFQFEMDRRKIDEIAWYLVLMDDPLCKCKLRVSEPVVFKLYD